jgi:hypothetical protein
MFKWSAQWLMVAQYFKLAPNGGAMLKWSIA